MAGGFLKGVLWGGVVSLGVAGTVSVLSDRDGGTPIAQATPDVTPEAAGEAVVTATPETVPQTTPEPVPEAAPEPVPEVALEPVPEIASQEEPKEPIELTAEPAPEEPPAEVEAAAEHEVLPAPVVSSETIAPSSPTIDDTTAADEVALSTETGQTDTSKPAKPAEEIKESGVNADTNPAPVPQVGNSASSLESPTVQAEPGRVDIQTDAQIQSDRSSDTLDLPQDEAPIIVATEPAAPPPPATPPAPEPAPELAQESAPEPAPEPTEVQTAAKSLPQIEATPTPETDETDPNEAASATDAIPDSQAKEEASLAPEIATSRLPTVQVTPTEPESNEVGEIVFDAALEPIRRFAVPFENTEAKPLMAIVLMDNGTGLASGSAGAGALSEFPYPITFAVDTSLADAAEKMQQYRADGFEVMAMVDLPEVSSATDTEVSMSVALSAIPEAVAVLEGTVTGVQGNREMSDQITSILADTGHGLVTRPKGLNTAQKLALRNGVPAATLFRDFDEDGQKPDVIRRYLDQAVFRAGQDGGVILVGRLRPDTISALLLWGLQDRAGRVALAPVSAVLTAQQE